MFTRPDGVTDDDVARALERAWGRKALTIEYAAVGFGSFHWRITSADGDWFVTIDDLDMKLRNSADTRRRAQSRLLAALTVARFLQDNGYDFVVAPVRTRVGEIAAPIGDRYVMAVYPYVAGETHAWGAYPSHVERLAVLDRLGALHSAPSSIAPAAVVDDFTIPCREILEGSLRDLGVPWNTGPFGERTRRLLKVHGDEVLRVLGHYDRLVEIVAGRPERVVLTHGEPHRGNTITTLTGVMLIDWDTALVAPRERDLWSLIDEDATSAHAYERLTGVAVDNDALSLYRLCWDLCEIAMFTADFRRPHDRTADTTVAWETLNRFMAPMRWTMVG
jgi:hypothetical protein